MFNLAIRTAAGMMVAGGLCAGVAQAAIGPDARACRGRGPAMIVNVDGFKARTGSIRINVYGSDPAKFLGRGEYIRQINLPVTRSGAMPVCVALPRAGRYAVAVRHDVAGDGTDWSDGGGFSRNPTLSLARMQPDYASVAINVGRQVRPVRVILNYRFGLTVRPVAS